MLHHIAGRSRRMQPALLGALLLAAFGCASHAPVQSAPPATPLRLSDFYVLPVGPRGLEATPRLLALGGQRVRIEGFMVHEEEPFPGFFMLAPLPVTVADRADGAADSLPPQTLFVHLAGAERERTVAYTPGPLELTGTLELGPREEASGRISSVRLLLEEPLTLATQSNTRGATE